jgi:hypothetical protein
VALNTRRRRYRDVSESRSRRTADRRGLHTWGRRRSYGVGNVEISFPPRTITTAPIPRCSVGQRKRLRRVSGMGSFVLWRTSGRTWVLHRPGMVPMRARAGRRLCPSSRRIASDSLIFKSSLTHADGFHRRAICRITRRALWARPARSEAWAACFRSTGRVQRSSSRISTTEDAPRYLYCDREQEVLLSDGVFNDPNEPADGRSIARKRGPLFPRGWVVSGVPQPGLAAGSQTWSSASDDAESREPERVYESFRCSNINNDGFVDVVGTVLVAVVECVNGPQWGTTLLPQRRGTARVPVVDGTECLAAVTTDITSERGQRWNLGAFVTDGRESRAEWKGSVYAVGRRASATDSGSARP